MARSNSRRRLIARTLLQAIPTMFGVVVLNFFLLKLTPGDAADMLAAQSGSATAETMAQWREIYGLDQPLWLQLWNYLGNLARFDLGLSPRYQVPVLDLILAALPNTLVLMGVAIAMAVVAGAVIGTVMALTAGSLIDRLLSVLVLVIYSVPGFWIGLMLIVFFSIHLGWLPAGGTGRTGAGLTGFAFLLDRLWHLVLPAGALALFYVAIYARLTRASVLEVRSQDYVRTAEAKGLAPVVVAGRHILRNALLPLTTMAGVHFSALFGGGVVIETVFSWPGLGRLAYDSVMGRDFNVLLGVFLFSSLLVIVINLAVDLLQSWLDPRIEA